MNTPKNSANRPRRHLALASILGLSLGAPGAFPSAHAQEVHQVRGYNHDNLRDLQYFSPSADSQLTQGRCLFAFERDGKHRRDDGQHGKPELSQ